MSELLSILPYLLLCAVLFIFLALGASLLLTARETAMERIGEWYFSLMHHSIEQNESLTPRGLLAFFRGSGVLCLAISALSGWMLFSRMVG